MLSIPEEYEDITDYFIRKVIIWNASLPVGSVRQIGGLILDRLVKLL